MAITNPMRTSVTHFYVAMFGRAPDAEGLSYWANRLDQGESLISLANAMYAVDPARTFYPTGATPTQIITSFYTNVLGRAPDSSGLAFWVGKLSLLGATPGSVILDMINNVINFQGSADPTLHLAGIQSRDLFLNRTEVAQYYSQKGGGIASAFTALQTVTANAASVATGKAAVDGLVPPPAPPAPSVPGAPAPAPAPAPVSATPTVLTITNDTPSVAAGPVTFTFTFNKNVTDFTASDITVNNGSKGTLVPLSPSVYKMVITPTLGFKGLMTVNVLADRTLDASGSGNAFTAVYEQQVNPNAPTISVVAGDDIVNNAEAVNLLISGTGAPNATITLVNTAQQTIVSSSGTWSIAVPNAVASFGQGPDALVVTQTDGTGANGGTAIRNISVDSVAPMVPTINVVAGDDIVNNTEKAPLVITGTAEPGSRVVLNGLVGLAATTDGAGNWAVTVPDAQAIFGTGPVTLSATATDAAGNPSAPGLRPISIDTQGPSYELSLPLAVATQQFSVMSSKAGTAGVYVGSVLLGNAAAFGAGGSGVVQVSPQATLTVAELRVLDTAGNAGSLSHNGTPSGTGVVKVFLGTNNQADFMPPETITGTAGADMLFGFGGPDMFNGFVGKDTVVGGDGIMPSGARDSGGVVGNNQVTALVATIPKVLLPNGAVLTLQANAGTAATPAETIDATLVDSQFGGLDGVFEQARTSGAGQGDHYVVIAGLVGSTAVSVFYVEYDGNDTAVDAAVPGSGNSTKVTLVGNVTLAAGQDITTFKIANFV